MQSPNVEEDYANDSEQRSENKDIDKKDEFYTPVAVDKRRAILAYKLFKCVAHSWTINHKLTQNWLRSNAKRYIENEKFVLFGFL